MDELAAARCDSKKKTSRDPENLSILPISYPRNLDSTSRSYPWILGSLDALSEERKKMKNKYQRTERSHILIFQIATLYRDRILLI